MSEETLFCLRVHYVETGRLRYLSHLELLRAVERTIRRARIPYAVTQGFSPRIKAAYCPALPVGVASTDEWFDLWVREYRPAGEYLAMLREAAPADLAPQEAAYVALHGPSLSAALTLATWEIDVGLWPGEVERLGLGVPRLFGPEGMRAAFEAVCAAGQITYPRNGKPKTVALEGKIARGPHVEALPSGEPGARIVITTRASNQGALRPDVLMGAVLGQLAESCAACGEPETFEASDVVSFKGCVRTSVVRTAQYLEGEDGTWVRPI